MSVTVLQSRFKDRRTMNRKFYFRTIYTRLLLIFDVNFNSIILHNYEYAFRKLNYGSRPCGWLCCYRSAEVGGERSIQELVMVRWLPSELKQTLSQYVHKSILFALSFLYCILKSHGFIFVCRFESEKSAKNKEI